MKLNEAVSRYLRDVRIGSSPQTVDSYACALRRFCVFLETLEPDERLKPIEAEGDVKRLTVRHALEFAAYMSERVEPATVKFYLSAVNQFFMFCVRDEILDLTTTDLLRLQQSFKAYRHKGHNRKFPKLPPTSDVEQCLEVLYHVQANTPRRELERLRNIALFEALRSSGMRVGEAVGLRRSDLDANDRSARVIGKGDKPRVAFFDLKAWKAIEAYLLARDSEKRLDRPVFARHDRRVPGKVLPMTTDGVRFVFNELRRAAKIEFHLTPHGLRHRFGTDALNVTHDLSLVQELMGHSSPQTTLIYAKVSPERLLQAHRQIFDGVSS